MKRAMDIIFSMMLLILFSLILVIGLCIVRLKLGTPILFKQRRPGLHGRPFFLYKLRTMTNDVDKNGNLLPDNVRLTAFGRVLRKYSLDELPQLVNVLKGDMSLVGPRPLLMEYLPLYTKKQFVRHTVKPGITGWAQVNGRNAISWSEKFALDIWYVKNQTLLLDCKILGLTILKVLKREGINRHGSATIEKFNGSQKGDTV